MTVSVVKNMGASVGQRLRNHARSTGEPFTAVLQYYAMERFLYRLSVSPHSDKFLLKGALPLTAWRAPISLPTMDIDLLGRTDNAIDAIVELMREVAQFHVHDDGISLDPKNVFRYVHSRGCRLRGRPHDFLGSDTNCGFVIDEGPGDTRDETLDQEGRFLFRLHRSIIAIGSEYF